MQAIPEQPADPEAARSGRLRKVAGTLQLCAAVVAIAAFFWPVAEMTFRSSPDQPFATQRIWFTDKVQSGDGGSTVTREDYYTWVGLPMAGFTLLALVVAGAALLLGSSGRSAAVSASLATFAMTWMARYVAVYAASQPLEPDEVDITTTLQAGGWALAVAVILVLGSLATLAPGLRVRA